MVRVGKAALTLVAGLLVGAVGTAVHRVQVPWGVIGALVLVVLAGVTARAFDGWPALASYGVGVVATVAVLSGTGPGGDVLVPEGQAVGSVWVYGAVAAVLLVAVIPRSAFDDRPRPVRREQPPTSDAG